MMKELRPEISALAVAMIRTALSFLFSLTQQEKWTTFEKKFWRLFAGCGPLLM
jgi:hypothetical protein